MRFNFDLKKFSKFVASAPLTYGLSLFLVFILTKFAHLSESMAYAVTQVVLLKFNFILARKWIFNAVEKSSMRQSFQFTIWNIAFRTIDWAIFSALVQWTPLPYPVALFLSLSIVFPVKYFLLGRYVFNY